MRRRAVLRAGPRCDSQRRLASCTPIYPLLAGVVHFLNIVFFEGGVLFSAQRVVVVVVVTNLKESHRVAHNPGRKPRCHDARPARFAATGPVWTGWDYAAEPQQWEPLVVSRPVREKRTNFEPQNTIALLCPCAPWCTTCTMSTTHTSSDASHSGTFVHVVSISPRVLGK